MKLKLWPWEEDGSSPYFVNPEGFEWWEDETLTFYAKKDLLYSQNSGLKDCVAFILRKDEEPVTRILLDNKSNILVEDTNFEQFAAKIDILKLQRTLKEEK